MQRIVVIGVTGSGKTTLANTLSQRLAIPHIEMDSIHWLPGWQERARDETRQIVTQRIAAPAWVMDGNYSSVRDITWQRADTLVWLDYPLRLSIWRLFWRILRRAWSRELLWGTNRDPFWRHFLTRDSLFWWAIKSRRKHRRDYPALFQQPEYAHLTVIRLRSPRETDDWLKTVKPSPVQEVDSAAHTSLSQSAPVNAPEHS
jgi:adenylate kinase family enzyme